MADLKLTTSQLEHIEALEQGAKVVIGSTSRIVWGPLYTFHKILSIVTLSSQLTKEYGETVVPVFGLLERIMILMK